MKALVIALPIAIASSVAASAQGLFVRAAEGWVIFDPTKDGYAYRYGPSIIVNDDGSIDAWFASPGGPGPDGKHQWDWIRHKRSDDGGRTWGPETIVLKPTVGSRDRQAVCDPGLIKLGDWYTLGVTAVWDPKGTCNEVFVSRSKSPTGPFEKWSGYGWGGMPMPIVVFREPRDVWGAGEPSFVVKGDTLFVYYTIISKRPDGTAINQTHVATAPADDPNWPGKLTHHGSLWDRLPGEDSADVKYHEGLGRFLAFCTASRMSDDSFIIVRESEDGLDFGEPVRVEGPLQTHLHNMGVSGDPLGHIPADMEPFIAYAYADGSRPGVSWGFWHTLLHPIAIARAEVGE